jgi:hypothetical protein
LYQNFRPEFGHNDDNSVKKAPILTPKFLIFMSCFIEENSIFETMEKLSHSFHVILIFNVRLKDKGPEGEN